MPHLPEFRDELGAVHLIDHPWILADCPLELLAAMWNDSLYNADPDARRDGTDLLTAWHARNAIPTPRTGDKPMTNPSEHDKLQVIWSTEDDQFYWHRQAANGQLIASGGEGFTREPDAWRAARRANPDLGEIE